MKHYRLFLTLTVLVVASLACTALAGGKSNSTTPNSSSGNQTGQSTATSGGNSSTTIKTDFPMTADAYNASETDGSLLYFTKLSQADLMKFYRDAYAAKGYKERTLLTVTSDTTLSMVFDGDSSGKAVVMQSVSLGDSSTVALRLESVP